MQISLADKDKCSMLFLGGNLNLTYDEPGPIEVDLSSLTTEQKTQIFFNWKRGILAVDDENQLKSACEVPAAPPKSYAFKTEAQPVTQPKDVDEALRAREVKLRALLREKIPAIKRKITALSAVELQELLKLEKITKNRQKLTEIIDEAIKASYRAVSQSVGSQDVGTSVFNPNAQPLDNSLDVVESDMVDVTLIPSDKELAKENG